MILLLLLLNLETPLRMPQILLTTPSNAYQFTPLDQLEDFFLSYPFISIKNDSIYFRGSPKVLLLLDGVPIKSLHQVCFPGIERVELLAEHASSPYGDYDAVLNIIPKKFGSTDSHPVNSSDRIHSPQDSTDFHPVNPKTHLPLRHSESFVCHPESLACHSEQSEESLPYSNIKLLKNPDYVQFELGKLLFKSLDFYLSGDLNSATKWSANLGYLSKFANLKAYLFGVDSSSSYLFQCSFPSNLKFLFTEDFFSMTQYLDFRNHKLLLGTDMFNTPTDASNLTKTKNTSLFIQDYWEPRPLLYLVPSIRYDVSQDSISYEQLYPKISVGFIPYFNVLVFSSITKNQLNLGARVFDSSINFYSIQDEDSQGIETRFVTPWLWDFKLTTSFDIPISPTLKLSDSSTIIAEHRKEFKNGKLGVYILAGVNLSRFNPESIRGDLLTETLRLELKLMDAQIFYRLNYEEPSYGFSWHFCD